MNIVLFIGIIITTCRGGNRKNNRDNKKEIVKISFGEQNPVQVGKGDIRGIELDKDSNHFNISLDVDRNWASEISIENGKNIYSNVAGTKLKVKDGTVVTFSVHCPSYSKNPTFQANSSIIAAGEKSFIYATKVCEDEKINYNKLNIICTVSIVLFVIIILIGCLLLAAYFFVHKTKFNINGTEIEKEELLSNENGVALIQRENVNLIKTIQEGKVGVVYQAELISKKKRINCIVKCITRNNNFDERMNEVSDEQMMQDAAQLYRFSHDNINSLIGFVIDKNEPYALFKYAELGNLKVFLRRCQLRNPKSHPSPKSMASTYDLLSIGHQAAEAIDYLNHQKFIHGDIATRNGQLGNRNKFLLCDKALSTDLFPSDYENIQGKLIPVRWSPPEALDCAAQTSLKGDIWSFGIFLWELISLAKAPYSDIEYQKINQYLQNGYRASKPPGCSTELYDLMTKCWEYVPEQRPTTKYILDVIEKTKNIENNIF